LSLAVHYLSDGLAGELSLNLASGKLSRRLLCIAREAFFSFSSLGTDWLIEEEEEEEECTA